MRRKLAYVASWLFNALQFVDMMRRAYFSRLPGAVRYPGYSVRNGQSTSHLNFELWIMENYILKCAHLFLFKFWLCFRRGLYQIEANCSDISIV